MEEVCLISKIEYDEDSIRPVILNFENGKLRPGQEKNLLCSHFRDQQKNTIVAAATDSMIYEGKINRDDLFNTFIGITNKKKNEMRLVAVDYATLTPVFQKESFVTTESTDSGMVNRAELYKTFGSKRAKRQTEQLQRMQIDIDQVKEQLEQTVADITIDVSEMVAAPPDENSSDYKPQIHRDATKVQDVYIIDEIVPPDVLNSMGETAYHILENGDVDNIDPTHFVREQINNLRKSASMAKEDKCQLLLYIDCLIKFMLKHAKALSVRTCNLCTYSHVVHQDILHKYTISTGKTILRPNTMRDKCLCSILVLSMIACEYQLNLSAISKELKLGLKKLQDTARVLAFNVSKEIASLSLPLPASVTNIRRDRKRKK